MPKVGAGLAVGILLPIKRRNLMKQDDYYKELVNTILDEQGNKQLPPTDSPQAVMLATPAPPFLEAISPNQARWSIPPIEEFK
jgi:hypothetical protein